MKTKNPELESPFLDEVTQNFRTPLTAIKAAATTLLEDFKGRTGESSSAGGALELDDETRREFLEIINEEADRLNELIGALVVLARAEAGDFQPRMNRTTVEEIVGNAVVRTKNLLDSHQMVVEIENEIPIVSSGSDSVAEVIYRLLENAAKFSPKSSRIRIRARRTEDESLEISVEDCGRGIPAELREKVFDKFFRVAGKDAQDVSTGFGLGLAIARAVVEARGGQIWIEDGRDGYKTRAVFQIPISNDEKR